jgi:PAS domain S-box-containing protein
METEIPTSEELVAEIKELRARMEIAEDALRAIRGNEVDAIVVGNGGTERVRTLSGADLCYRTFVEAMRQGAATVSGDGTILYCNRFFCDLVRADPEIAPGTSIFSFVSAEDEGRLRTMLWEALTSAGSNQRFALRASDGSSISTVLTATLMAEEGAKCVSLVLTDLSEHEARLAAEAASHAKDRFLASLSHELRTPLMPAYMTISALATDKSLPEAVRKALANVRRNLELETRLIDDLLDLSRLINGKMNLRREPVSVHWLIERVGEIFKSDLYQKSLKLNLKLDAHDTVEGDPSRLQQVLWNLLSNAMKFSQEHGEITFSTSNPESGTLRVQITDTGAGIEPDMMPKLFEAFEQGEAAMIRRQGGLGLGLSIAKPIVEAHGGTLEPHSEGAGKGATFTITLPTCAATATAMGGPEDETDGTPKAPLRVLLVEDHVETALLLKAILENSGHRVAVAGDVMSAIGHAESMPFDIIVSDIGLPDGTGYDLMRRIHQRYRIPGVALSGYGMDDDLQQSREAGFADHIIKPVDVHQLESVMYRVARAAAKPANGG